MGSVVAGRRLAIGALLLVGGLIGGCAQGGKRAVPEPPTRTLDGLISSPSSAGALFIKPDHNLAGYDEIFFEPVKIFYRRGHKALEAREEAALLRTLERGERERARDAGMRVASVPGPCAVSLRFYIADLELTEIGSSSVSQTIFVATVGTVALIADIRDSETGEALLRFGQRRTVLGGDLPGPPHAVAISRLRKTLDTMLSDFGTELLEVIPRSPPQPPVSSECSGYFRAIGNATTGARDATARFLLEPVS